MEDFDKIDDDENRKKVCEEGMDLIDFVDLTECSDESQGTVNCPLCGNSFPINDIEQHAESCGIEQSTNQMDIDSTSKEEVFVQRSPFDVDESLEDDRRFALELLAQEEREMRHRVCADEQLAREMMEAQEKEAKEIQARVSESSIVCVLCGEPPQYSDQLRNSKDQQIAPILFLEECAHPICLPCISRQIKGSIDSGKASKIPCPGNGCGSFLTIVDVKEASTSSDFEAYEKAVLMEMVKADGDFITCPNMECGNVIERIKEENPQDSSKSAVTDLGPDGKPLSAQAIQHRDLYRFRCRECQKDFCSQCLVIPYHLGFDDCDSYSDHASARVHCRYCGNKVIGALFYCNDKECKGKAAKACGKKLSCGHICFGTKNERSCPPCLEEDCVKEKDAEGEKQTRDSYCNICWTEDLGGAPCICLTSCGHFFHGECALQKVEKGWSTSRISFAFLECALCRKEMNHPFLQRKMRPMLRLKNEVRQKALKRLEMIGGAKSVPDVLDDKTSRYYKDPAGYSLYRFSFFRCFKCQKPYFGGEKVCEGNDEGEFDPKELICAGCSDFKAEAKCKKHGDEFIEYKCRFCCNTSVWFCFGTTHFCEACHRKAGTITTVPKHKLPKCTCNIKHPPNGDEFLLGCSLCRLQRGHEVS